MGRRTLPGQNTDDVLMRFGRKKSTARKNYRAFVEGGISKGKRNDLVGGGLKRSLQSVPTKEMAAYDQRILGSGPFVEELRHGYDFDASMPLEALVESLAGILEVDPQHLQQRTKKKRETEARNVISYVAVRCRGYNGAELARHFNVTRSAISTGAERGRHLVEDSNGLQTAISKLTK
jgi:transposase